MSAHVFKMTAFAVLAFGLLSQNVKAQSLFGSGAMQGGMVCPYQQTASRAGTNISDEEREARAAVARLQAQKSANATKRDQLYKPRVDAGKRKIEQYFDADVADFLLTHIDTLKRCDQYQSLANRCATPPAGSPAPASGDAAAAAPAPTVDCAGLEPVPALLVGKWTEARGGQGNYCVGSTARSAGSVAASICSDNTLLPENPRTGRRGRGSVSSSACARALTDYRKATLDFSAAQDEEDRLVEEIATRNENINEARVTAEIERRSRVSTEAGCETCDAYSRGYSYQRPQRDWGSTLTNVIGGLGLMYVGRQAERANAEESAQLGMPSNQSYGYPYYQAGIAGVINGLAGPGAYGCASTTGGGGPIGFTANGGLNLAGGGGAFGPAGAQGGAFGYPQNMYGSPWGGGAFNPGLNINGGFNGPFGGTGGGQFGGTGGGQFGQFPGNGNMAMCFTFPCNVGGQGGAGGQFGVGGQLGIGGQFGQPQIGYDPTGQFGNQFGLNGQLSAQYQLQMLQQQQQAAQQYYQQQQQYYQQQYQAQMQYYQQVQQRQQQAAQLQQQIAQLNMQLQQIYYSNNGFGGAGSIGGSLGGSAYLGANFNLGTSYGSATIGAPLPGGYNSPTIGNPTIGNPGFNPGYNPGISNPTPGTGGTVRGR